MNYINDINRHFDRFQIGMIVFALGFIAILFGYAVIFHLREVLLTFSSVGGFIGAMYALGYLAPKILNLTAYGKAKSAAAEREIANREYINSVPIALVVIHDDASGRNKRSICSVSNTSIQPFLVGPGSAEEIAEQARHILDEHGVNALQVYHAKDHRCTSYMKTPDGTWTNGFDDGGTEGLNHIKWLAAINQRKHEQAASGSSDITN